MKHKNHLPRGTGMALYPSLSQSRKALPLFGGRQTIRQVQTSSTAAQVKDAPLLLGAGQCLAETAGNHMTQTVAIIGEGVRTNAWNGSKLGQRV